VKLLLCELYRVRGFYFVRIFVKRLFKAVGLLKSFAERNRPRTSTGFQFWVMCFSMHATILLIKHTSNSTHSDNFNNELIFVVTYFTFYGEERPIYVIKKQSLYFPFQLLNQFTDSNETVGHHDVVFFHFFCN
jgi:hypothetical protein